MSMPRPRDQGVDVDRVAEIIAEHRTQTEQLRSFIHSVGLILLLVLLLMVL